GQAAPDELRVDEQGMAAAPRQIDVGEQPAVDVAALGVEAEGDRPVADQALVGIVRFGAAALHRGVGLDGLRRVDADVADTLLVAARHPDVDRVPVDDVGDADADGAGGLGRAAARVAAARDREYDKNSGNEERRTKRPATHWHYSMMLRAPELS